MAVTVLAPPSAGGGSIALPNTLKTTNRVRINPINMLQCDPSLLTATPVWSPPWPVDSADSLAVRAVLAKSNQTGTAAGFKLFVQTIEELTDLLQIFNVAAGSGYNTPTTTITGGGGSGAVIYPIVAPITSSTNGQLVGFYVANGGTGYTTDPTITVVGGGNTGAQGTAGAITRVNGVITAVALGTAGSGYGGSGNPLPTFTLTDGGGSGAAGYPVLANGQLFAGASATTTYNGGVVTAAGSGYSYPPFVTVAGGVPTVAGQMVAVLSGGALLSFQIKSGYVYGAAYLPGGSITVPAPQNSIGPITDPTAQVSAVLKLSRKDAPFGSKVRVGVSAVTAWGTAVAGGLSVTMLLVS